MRWVLIGRRRAVCLSVCLSRDIFSFHLLVVVPSSFLFFIIVVVAGGRAYVLYL
ncbi:hypothetical protein BKA81DRAFT_347996 [Phyllosticta paracitricarpa]